MGRLRFLIRSHNLRPQNYNPKSYSKQKRQEESSSHIKIELLENHPRQRCKT